MTPPLVASRPIRWGIVGTSDIADRVMAPAMRGTPAAELVAIASRSPARARAFAARHQVARTYPSAATLADDPDIDAVYVATEVDRHVPDVLAAAEAGRDVLVEKPIARSAIDGQRMVEACARAGVRLGTCFYQRYNTRHTRIRTLLADGAIGSVAAVQLNFSGRLLAQPGTWRQDPERSGGGSFIDSASHCVDLVRWLFGDVVEVAALTATLSSDSPSEDTASVILRMGNGVQVVITAHWSTTDPSDQRASVMTIGGSDGSIVSWPLHDKFSRGTLLLARADGEVAIPVPERSTHIALLDDLAAARAQERPFPISGDDGVAAQRVVDAVYESGRTGRMVTLS